MNTKILSIGGDLIEAEVADTFSSWKLGLKYRDSLGVNCGMLFIFDREDYYAMDMVDVKFPLTVIFIDSDWVVSNVCEMQAGSSFMHWSSKRVKYALEVNSGRFSSGVLENIRVSVL